MNARRRGRLLRRGEGIRIGRCVVHAQGAESGAVLWEALGVPRAVCSQHVRSATAQTRFGAIKMRLRDREIGVHVTPLIIDEIHLLPGVGVSFHAEAGPAHDNLVNNGADHTLAGGRDE